MIAAKYKDLSVEIEGMLSGMSDMSRLPGVSLLAKKFNSAPRTVSKALKLMSEKGKVTINGTKGTFVTKSARNVVTHKRIGLLDTMEEGFSRAEKNSLIRLCEKNGYEHFTIEYNNANSKKGISFISSLPADGFVLNYSTITPDLAISLRQSGKQFVSINQIFDMPGASWVDFDNEATIKKALDVLAAQGRKRIALIAFKWGLKGHHEGIKNTYKKCMNKIVAFDDKLWYAEKDYMDYFKAYGENAYSKLGKEAAGYLMKLRNPPDAMIILSEWIASGAYGVLLDCGLKIPQDISLLVYSTGEKTQVGHTPVYSTIGYPYIRKVQRAVEILTELIENPEAGPIQELLPFNIRKGETT